jgi:hypothetical protein
MTSTRRSDVLVAQVLYVAALPPAQVCLAYWETAAQALLLVAEHGVAAYRHDARASPWTAAARDRAAAQAGAALQHHPQNVKSPGARIGAGGTCGGGSIASHSKSMPCVP